MSPHVNVIVFDENKLLAELGIPHHLGYLLQDSLAGRVPRVGFARIDKLYGAFCIVDHRGEPFEVSKDEVGSLVSCEPAREADGKCVGDKDAPKTQNSDARFSYGFSLLHRALPDKVEQTLFQVQVSFPEFAVVNTLDTL